MSIENKWKYLRSIDSEFENRVFECVKEICQFSIINDEVNVEEYVDSVCDVMSSLTDECFVETVTRRLVKDIVYLMKERYKNSEKKYDYDDYFQIHKFLSENVTCDELLDDVYSMNGKLSQNFQSVLV